MANFTESRGWKLFMGKLYGLGAAVVIVGALFKLEHFPGASIMLIVGMSVEAFIFICSAFEPLPHPEPRWELVYPELAGGEAHAEAPRETRKKKISIENVEIATVATGSNGTKSGTAITGGGKVGDAVALSAIGNIDLSKINVEKITSGLNKLGETAGKLTGLSDTMVAANTLSEKMHHASLTVANFSQSYENSAVSLSESMHALSDSYHGSAGLVSTSVKQMSDDVTKASRQVNDIVGGAAGDFAKAMSESGKQIVDEAGKTSKQMVSAIVGATEDAVKFITNSGKSVNDDVNKAGKQMADVIGSATETFAATFTIIDRHLKDSLNNINQGNNTYNKQVEALNKNMSALNTVYELQAQETGKYHKNSSVMGQHLEKLVVELNRSVEENRNFSREITQLNKNIIALNGIYGSMLSAVELTTGKK
ncbi:MAG: gliding motility protein GldL [Prevotellaceae bacterium]|jgi:gliding motility-associated protein GldL|nr:gliding motility protein GldL [Prevotellaceae bacterium]